MENITALFLDSLILWVLFLLSILALAVIIERLCCFYHFRYSAKTIQQIKKELQNKNSLKKAISYCSQKGIFATFYKKILENLNRPVVFLESFCSNLCQEYILVLEKRVSILSTIATIAPLLGILGTVLGMIDAFMGLDQVKENNDFLVKGIAEALFSTALGLIVAIPAIVFYNFFTHKIDTIAKHFENDLVDIILLGKKTPATKK